MPIPIVDKSVRNYSHLCVHSFSFQMEEHLFKLPPFEFKSLPVSEQRTKWIEYKESFLFRVKAIKRTISRKRMKIIFLDIAGPQLRQTYRSLAGPTPEIEEEESTNGWQVTSGDTDDPFKAMMTVLDAYFTPKRHDLYERSLFWSLTCAEGETLNNYQLRVQSQAEKCSFGCSELKSREMVIMDKMVAGLPDDLRRKVLEKEDIDLDKLTRMINGYLSVQSQNRDISTMNISTNSSRSETVATVGRNDKVNKKRTDSKSHCFRCGRESLVKRPSLSGTQQEVW